MYENLVNRMKYISQTQDYEAMQALLQQAVCVMQDFEFDESRCPIGLAQAIRILHPSTTKQALREIVEYKHLSGKAAKKAAVDDACMTACLAMSHIILNAGR